MDGGGASSAVRRRRLHLILLFLSVLAAFGLLGARRIGGLDPGWELEGDAFYHVAMADRAPGGCIQRTFPATDASLWKERFYDKELLYHLILGAVRGAESLVRSNARAPFHGPALFFTLVLLVVFAHACRRTDEPWAWVWILPLAALSPTFANRSAMLRPHVLAVALMILAAHAFLRTQERRRLWVPALFGFLFAYAYSNPHFVLGPALVAGAMRWRSDRSLAWGIPGATLAGLVCGMLLHPQAPNTFILWKVQCVDVPLAALRGRSEVDLGAELLPPTARWLVRNAAVPFLASLNALVAARIVLAARRNPLSRDASYFLALQTLAIPGFFLSHRVIEYAVPFTLLASAALWRELREDLPGVGPRGGLFRASYLAVALALPAVALPLTWNYRAEACREFGAYGRWASRNLPDGTLVANLGWEDFPRLYQAAPHCRYLVGLDPMFGYVYRPRVILGLLRFKREEVLYPPEKLRQLTGADYAFVSAAQPVAGIMTRSLGYVPLFTGEEGFVFDLRAKRGEGPSAAGNGAR
jgi:hypothetical protein